MVVIATSSTAFAARSVEIPAAPPVELQGMLPASAETLRAAVTEQKQNPNDAQSNGHLAMLLHAHDRPRAASAYYARARALDNDSFRWAYLHGLCLEALGETEAALQALRRAVTIDANYVPAVLKLAGMLLANGENRDSGNLVGQAVEKHAARADVQFSWGRWLLSNDRATDAIAPLLEALRINGHFAEGHYLLAAAFRETGSVEKALQHQALFEQHADSKLLVADPERLALNALNTTDRPYLLAANEMIQAGRYEAAIVQYERAAETNPSRMVTRTNLIMLYGRTGDVSSARKNYEAALAINPEDPQLHFQYGNLMLAQRQFDDAARHFERSLSADPAFANAWAQLGEARDALRNRPAATDAYREALKIDPNHRQANYRYGRHLVLHDVAYAEALDHMARALEPEDATTVLVLHAMAGIYAVQNRFEDAVATLEQARRVSRRHGAPPNLVARIDAELARFRSMLNK